MSKAESIITEATGLSLKLVITLCVAIATGTGFFVSVKNDLREIKNAQRQVVTRSEFANWSRDLRDENRGLSVPMVSVPQKDFYE